MHLRFLGCGDAFGSGGRFNTCFHVSTGETGFLIDCGASSLIAMRRQDVEPNSIRTIFISHLHGDHFGGLPFFILEAQLYSRRSEPLTIAGPLGLKARLDDAMEVLFPGSSRVQRKFEVEVIELPARTATEVNGVTVTPFEVEHPCGAPPYALRLACAGKVIAYTGDSQWCQGLADCGRDADLLIAETLFYDKPIRFHLDYKSLKAHLPEIAPKRLVLTHFGPDMLARLDDPASPIEAERSHDGLVVEL